MKAVRVLNWRMQKNDPGTLPTDHIGATYKTGDNREARWVDLEDFIRDPAIGLMGYMPPFPLRVATEH